MSNTIEKMIEMCRQLRYCAIDDDCINCERWAVDCGSRKCLDGLLLEAAELLESVANSLTVQEWISVKDRLPQEDLPVGALCEVVQVLLDDGSVTIGWCNRGLRCWFHMPVRETKMVGHDYENTPVIAWQPLSQPPKP